MITLLLFAACGTADPTDTSSPADTAGSADSADTGDTQDTGDTGDTQDTGPAIPDARDAMIRNADACEEIGGHTDVPAAEEYYWGQFVGNETDGWTGEEAWYLFGNTAWHASGREDCEVHFTVTAVKGNVGKCASCDVGLVAHAEVDLATTTCSPGQYAGYEVMDEPYAVELLGDGSADWSFPSSGTVFGHGYWVEGALNYLSDGGCDLPAD